MKDTIKDETNTIALLIICKLIVKVYVKIMYNNENIY